MIERLGERIDSATDYLVRRQLPDGEFPTLRRFLGAAGAYGTPTEFEGWINFGSCPFATANIAYHLRGIDDPRIAGIVQLACRSLAVGMENGVARYVPSAHKPADFPTDVDDTCLAIAAIRANGRKEWLNAAMIFDNVDRDGQVLTWLVPRWRHLRHPRNYLWLHRDAQSCRERLLSYGAPPERLARADEEYRVSAEPAIAANVLLCLGVSRRTRRQLRGLLAAMESGGPPLQYYAHPVVPHFHVARLYDAGVEAVASLRGRSIALVEALEGTPGDVAGPFNSVLAALTLMFWGAWDSPVLPRLMRAIVESPMHADGWVPLHYCNDLDGVFVDGGAELTAAFHLDAMHRYRMRLGRGSA